MALIGFILLCNGAGFLSSLGGHMALYGQLALPAWAPPPLAFPIAWGMLYTLMGIGAWLVWRAPASPARRRALGMFVVQLLVNMAWTPVFFGAEWFRAGLVVIALVWFAVLAMVIAYRRVSGTAAALQIPLLLWVGFATALNAAIVVLN